MLKIMSKRQLAAYMIAIFIYLTLAVGYGKATSPKTSDDRHLSVLETAMGGVNSVSVGNDYGTIYSVDGKAISEKNEGHFASIDGFAETVGCETSGMIRELAPVLLSNISKSNRSSRKGNSIVTTLSYKGTETAHNMMSEYDFKNVSAGICVVIADGAVLVDATNAFDNSDIDVNCNVAELQKGSSFKPLVYRMLLGHRDELSDDLNFTDGSFEDISILKIGSRTVHNWDYHHPENYDYVNGTSFSRQCSLSDLLKFSSNTAPLRLCSNIGFDGSYEYMDEIYHLDSPLVTEVNTLVAQRPSDDEMVDYFYGQGAKISSLRMCQLFNFTVSGDFLCPFYCASVVQPDGTVLYRAHPKPIEEYSLNIDVENDILNNALKDAFESYVTPRLRQEFSDELLTSRRFLAKSGTAELGDGNENRVLMLSVLNEEKTAVICSACISVNGVAPETISNDVFIEKLLNVLKSAGVI